MTLFEILVGIGVGLIAGVINTLAGNGSALTLAVLLEFFGLPAHMANGTNRIGALTQSWSSVLGFQQEGRLEIKGNIPLILLPVLGAFLGIYLAIIISAESFIFIYKYLLVLMLLVTMIKPKRWMSIQTKPSQEALSIWLWPLYFLLGVYGGFIQMGIGIFSIAVFVLLSKKDLISANVLKVLIIALFSIPAVAIFAWKGMIHWGFGLVIALGQTTGGWFTAIFASRYEKAGQVAYYVLILCILGAVWSVFFR